MLCLSRNVGESIVAGTGENQIVFTVIESRNGKVRIGIVAGKGVPIYRTEVHKRIQAEQASAEEKGGEG